MQSNLSYFTAMSDVVVMGSNPENADITNPRGEYHGFAAYVVAEYEDGARVRLYVTTEIRDADAMAAVEPLVNALNARWKNLGKLPVGFGSWQPTFPCYGSDAFSNEEMRDWEHSIETGYGPGEF